MSRAGPAYTTLKSGGGGGGVPSSWLATAVAQGILADAELEPVEHIHAEQAHAASRSDHYFDIVQLGGADGRLRDV